MKRRSLSKWSALALEDPQGWRRAIQENIDACVRRTGSAVVAERLEEPERPPEGPLSGVPYAIKDLFDWRGSSTRCSSPLPEAALGRAQADAEVVHRMRSLGARCVAKTQMHQFAYGLTGQNPHCGDCPHPLLEGCLAGGSSGGSAHLVAGGYLPVAFGTDTGGSIRLPAAWCGLYGVRWAPGRWTKGAFPLAPSFDAIGWFTRSLADMRRMIQAWFGLAEEGAPAIRQLKGVVALPPRSLDQPMGGVLETMAKACGARRKRWRARNFAALRADAVRAFDILQSDEAYGVHRHWLERYGDLYDPAVRERIERARQWTEDDRAFARDVRKRATLWFERQFDSFDYVMLPAAPNMAATPAEATPKLREAILSLTVPASLAGLPVLTIPIRMDSGHSFGMQFVFKSVEPDTPLGLLDLVDSIA